MFYFNILIFKEFGFVELFFVGGEMRVEINMEFYINIIEDERVIDVNDFEIIEVLKRKLGKEVKFVNVFVERQISLF